MKKKVFTAFELMETIEEDEYDDMESWEADADLFYQQDWKGLIELRYQIAKSQPKDMYCQWQLGEAYVLGGEYEKAISFLGGLHKKCPEDINVQYSLIDALVAMGKDESDFNWIIKPSVAKLNSDTLDCCFDYLHTKRKHRSVHELYLLCYDVGYPMFRVDQFKLLLQSDDRFSFTEDEYITLNRKRDSKKR